MKSPISSEYVVVVTLLAVTAAALSYLTPHAAFSLCALLLGIYALHLVSLRIVVRQYEGVAPGFGSAKGSAAEAAAEVARVRDELDLERRELENRKAELQQRIMAAEQQWELLRQMIRDRVEGSGAEPDSVVAGAHGGPRPTSMSAPGRGNGSDDSPRIHGRW